ncbi:MAG: hypothetical protein M1130_06440 [Actinobacteria bacterium]|nr:hypothetical protein [Actinomycetota bacterium]
MSISTKNCLRPDPAADSRAPLSTRFANPIVKVSIRSGVICNRIEKFWIDQTIQTTKECAS